MVKNGEQVVLSLHDTMRLVPFVHAKLAKNAFNLAGPDFWNNLPQALHGCDSLT